MALCQVPVLLLMLLGSGFTCLADPACENAAGLRLASRALAVRPRSPELNALDSDAVGTSMNWEIKGTQLHHADW